MESMLVNKTNGENIIVSIKENLTIGDRKKVIISGPCAVENYDVMREIAFKLKEYNIDILRGGTFKPRTSPYDFQGLGEDGLSILKAVGDEFNLPIVTEVLDPRDLNLVATYSDIIQIGSRNMYNYSLLKEVGKLKIPVILKRGFSATITEWLSAAEYILKEGNNNVILCERGIRTFETAMRNTLDLSSVALIKKKYRLPIIVDPSHGTGIRELVRTMSRAAICAGADGLMIESHTCPDCAISDAKQTVNVNDLVEIKKEMNELSNLLMSFDERN